MHDTMTAAAAAAAAAPNVAPKQKRGTSAIWVAKSELSKLETLKATDKPEVVVDEHKKAVVEPTSTTKASNEKKSKVAPAAKGEEKKRSNLANQLDQVDASQEQEDCSSASSQSGPQSLVRQVSLSKLNAEAPVFVPKISSSLPNSLGNLQAGQPGIINLQVSSSESSGEQDPSCQSSSTPQQQKPVALSEELRSLVVQQVEFYFSDGNLSTDPYLLKTIKKDPDGFVPIPIIGSFRKVKQLTKNHTALAAALRTSSKLVVSEDGKKVKRAKPFEDADLDDLQSRTIVAENLPADRSIQNLEKVFGAVGTIKALRVCEPDVENGMTQNLKHKVDRYVSNKLHALVEYETVEQAEKAVSELTDQRNWRSGLHVRLLLRRIYPASKHAKSRKNSSESHEAGEAANEEEGAAAENEAPTDPTSEETGVEEKEVSKSRGRGRGRGGRGRGRGLLNNMLLGTSPQIACSSSLGENGGGGVICKPPLGPRMPDGTRGFTFGRGRAVSS